jgi:hypothetical protein
MATHFTANRALAPQEIGGHPERFGLVGLGVGDKTAMQTLGRAGSLGQNGGQLTGGTGFSGHDGRVSLRRHCKGTLREARQIACLARRPRAADAP